MGISCRIKRVIGSIENVTSTNRDTTVGVKLVAVTKTLNAKVIKEAYEAGVRDFGENKVQEILEKFPQLPSDVRWHLIGHLQTNKVRQIVDKVYMIHSLDSLRLAAEIEKRAAVLDRRIPCLVQVNIADEESKFGLKKEEVEPFLREMPRFPHVVVAGLMTIGPHVEDREKIRGVFQELRGLKEYLATLSLPAVKMRELSMGMSNDYIVAVEEGATMVRVGTSIFGIRSK